MERIHYLILKKDLKEMGFSEIEAKAAINNIRRMDPEIKQKFFDWYVNQVEPDFSVGVFSYRDFVNILKMNRVTAFLFLDWMKKEPETAKKALRLMPDFIKISNEDKEKIESQLSEEDLKEEPEDISDIALT